MNKSISQSTLNRLYDLLERSEYRLQSLSDIVYTTKAEEVSGLISQIEFDNWVRDFRVPDSKLRTELKTAMNELVNLPVANQYPDLKLNVTEEQILQYKLWGKAESRYKEVFGVTKVINSRPEWEAALQDINKELNLNN